MLLPHRTVQQAKALLWAGEGIANEEIARRCPVDSDTVGRWRCRFETSGVNGVEVIAPGRAPMDGGGSSPATTCALFQSHHYSPRLLTWLE